jgi:hypothetical protein
MRTKATIVYLTLIALSVWPLCHIALVRHYGLSPWKLAGWGMYATPRFDGVGMEIFGRIRPTDDWTQLAAPTPSEQRAAQTFLARYRWLRRLAGRETLVDVVHRIHPSWSEIRVVVFEPVLVRATGIVEERRTTFHFPGDEIEITGAEP